MIVPLLLGFSGHGGGEGTRTGQIDTGIARPVKAPRVESAHFPHST